MSYGSGPQFARLFGQNNEALVDAQAGEFVIERFAREDGAIVYRGRSTAHYARPAVARKVKERTDQARHSNDT